MVQGTNEMIVYPLESSKIVSKLAGISTKSQGIHKQGITVASLGLLIK